LRGRARTLVGPRDGRRLRGEALVGQEGGGRAHRARQGEPRGRPAAGAKRLGAQGAEEGAGRERRLEVTPTTCVTRISASAWPGARADPSRACGRRGRPGGPRTPAPWAAPGRAAGRRR